MSKAQSILQRIREKHSAEEKLKEKLFGPESNYNELNIRRRYLSADEWQDFKRKFIEEYSGEPVQPTGMTHSEFLNYIRTSGDRENDEYTWTLIQSRSLREILESLD
jgi:hypothetical protein